MRVLHVINDLRPAGAEMLLRQLAPQLQKRGCEVHVACLVNTPSFVRDELAGEGVPLHVPAVPAGFYAGHQQIPFLARVMRETRFDIAHIHLFPAQLWAALALQSLPKKNRPYLLTTEHNTHNRRRDARWGRPLDRVMYARYAHVVAITDATKASLCDWVPATCAKTTVIQNGVHLARMENAAPADKSVLLDVSPAEAAQISIVTCVGRLETQKNQASLLHALALLPPNVQVVLVGVGDMETELRTLAAQLHITSRVHLLGRRADVPHIVCASDVYVQPSRWEGFGIAAVEALAAGVPVVVSDVPGLRDVVGDAGRVVEAGNAPALAHQIKLLLALSGEERAQIAERGRGRARLFSIEACADAHVRLYGKLIGA